MDFKRITLFMNGSTRGGKVVACPETIEELKALAVEVMGIPVQYIFGKNGGHFDSVDLIRDDDVIYCSTGPDFIGGIATSSLNRLTEQCFEEPRQRAQIVENNTDWLLLNVGGRNFATTRRTLMSKAPLSMLARMFSLEGRLWPSVVDKNGAYLIDRSPRYFEPILNYLRHGQLVIENNLKLEGVLEEAKFYGIQPLVNQLESCIALRARDDSSLGRKEVISLLAGTSSDKELRFQGINLEGADLSKMDLQHVNFKFSNLRGCRLAHCNLSFCCFERADLTGADLEGAVLEGVRMLCANMERCNLSTCDMETGAMLYANLESANLKSAVFEGSRMSGVNLRVATLKNANMQNCYLRHADLAGADLENCNLSGSDLQGANLRGANLKDAVLDRMLSPLHMAQAIR